MNNGIIVVDAKGEYIMKREITVEDIFGDSLNLKISPEDDITIALEEVLEAPKLIKVTSTGIEVLDEGLMNKIKKKNLSASLVNSITQCPADWLMESFILNLVDHEEPIHFVRGHIIHDTMERFFAYPKEERNPKLLSRTAMAVIQEKYKESLDDKETMNWVKTALTGYLETGFEYKNIDVAQIVKKKGEEPTLGVELFVMGKIGNATRKVVGYIDRLDRMPDGRLSIVDYKTGGRIYKDSFDYERQQLAYTMLLEQDGYEVGAAKLEFPIARGVVDIDINSQEKRTQVEIDFEAADNLLTKCIEDNFFPFKGHHFCKWCGTLSPKFPTPKYGKPAVSWTELNMFIEHDTTQ